MRALILALALLPAGLALAALESTDPEQAAPGRLTPEQWSQDIDALVGFLRQTHPNLATAIPDGELDRAARRLKADLPNLDHNQVIGGLFRIVALARDDSTYVYPFQDSIGFGLMPLLAYWFSDGLYVIDAMGEVERFIGHRITKFGDMSTDSAFKKLSPYLSGENMQGKRFLFTRNAFVPELAYAAGLSTTPDATTLTLRSPEGIEETVAFGPAPVEHWKSWSARVVDFDGDDLMFEQHADDAFWFEKQADTGTLFVRVRELRDQDTETLAEFAERLRIFADTESFERIVIDARYGGGGSGHAMEPLVEVITTHPRINRDGRLFGIIGRVTRGTVLEFISVLENNSRMVLVGESTMDAPNGVGDPVVVTLPHSTIEVAITEVFWPTTFADDPRRAIAPDVTVMYRHADWRQAGDPALAAVSSYQQRTDARQPIATTVMEQLSGEYEVGPGQTVAITHDGDTLTFSIRDSDQQTGQSFFRAKGALYAQNETRLSSDIRDVFIEFENTSDGNIEQPMLIWRGVAKPLYRVAEPATDDAPEGVTAEGDGAQNG